MSRFVLMPRSWRPELEALEPRLLLDGDIDPTPVPPTDPSLADITGQKFRDLNANGLHDADEPGLDGWTIQLVDPDNGSVLSSAVTASVDLNGDGTIDPSTEMGLYSFLRWRPDTYLVREAPQPGWGQTAGGQQYQAALSQYDNAYYSNVLTFVFPATGYPLAGGQLAITAFGDFDAQTEYLHVQAEGIDLGNFFVTDGANYHRQTRTVNLTRSQLANLAADGSITITVTPSMLVGNDFYTVEEVTLGLTYPHGSYVVNAPAGVETGGIDFGNWELASIAGRQFEDLDGDGLPDADEPGADGWSIELRHVPTGELVATAVTASVDLDGDGTIDPLLESGLYCFADLGPGPYALTAAPRPGWVRTTPDPVVEVQSGQAVEGQDFEAYRQPVLSGQKYSDLDADGERDAGEGGLDGWLIQALNATSQAVVATATTRSVDLDSSGTIDPETEAGLYTFDSLPPGDYVIREVLQYGWVQKYPTDPSTDYAVHLSSGDEVLGLVFGNHQLLGEIAGRKFHDLNANGVQDAGEAGLDGWTIELVDGLSGAVLATTVTAAIDLDSSGDIDPETEAGLYSFTGWPAGTYVVREVQQDGWVGSIPQSSVLLAAGDAIRVTEGASEGHYPRVGVAPSGEFVVTWRSDNAAAPIIARHFGADGTASGSQFRVNEVNVCHWSPSVGMDDLGDFVISWLGEIGAPTRYTPYARLYLADSTPVGGPFEAGTPVYSLSTRAALAVNGTGRFAVVWEVPDGDGSGLCVRARICLPDGTPVGDPFQVNTFQTGDQCAAGVAMDDVGRLVVVWQSDAEDGEGDGIFARLFDPDGVPLGLPFQVNTYTASAQSRPAVAMAGGGDFVVTWQSEGQDGSANGIYARRFFADGTPNGGEFRVNTWTAGEQAASAVAMADDARFVVLWQSDGQDGASYGVYGRLFRPDGTPACPEFLVNQDTSGQEWCPAVAMTPLGDFVAVWGNENSDTIWARQFTQAAWVNAHTVALEPGEVREGVDFGNYHPASVSGQVFEDFDCDGARDGSEGGVDGWRVELVDPATGAVIRWQLTTSVDLDSSGDIDPLTESGLFVFDDAPPGSRELRIAPRDGWVQSLPAAQSYPLVLPDGGSAEGLEFGAFQGASIAGQLFEDADEDGEHDAGEPGVDGWTIELLDAATQAVLRTAVTASVDLNDDGTIDPQTERGLYAFDGLVPGDYVVRQVERAGWIATNPASGSHSLTLAYDEDAPGLDFGNAPDFARIRGRKYHDLNANGQPDPGEGGLDGWTIEVVDTATGAVVAATVTASVDLDSSGTIDPATETGVYAFDALPYGQYVVRELAQAGWTQSYPANPLHFTETQYDNCHTGCYPRFYIPADPFRAGEAKVTVTAVAYLTEDQGYIWAGLVDGGSLVRLFAGTGVLYSPVTASFTQTEAEMASAAASGTIDVALTPVASHYLGPEILTVELTWPANGYGRHEVTLGPDDSAELDFGGYRPVSVSGRRFEDYNANGRQDAGEPAFAGPSLFLDANGNGVRDGTWVFPARDVPVAVPDYGTVLLPMEVTTPWTQILDVNVRVDSTHSAIGDLDIFLTSPQGTYVKLMTDLGGLDDNLHVTYDDDVPTPPWRGDLTAGGTYRPEGFLYDFDGEDPNGVWTLQVTDDAAGNIGTLDGWSLILTFSDLQETLLVSDGNGEYLAEGLLPGAYTVIEPAQPGWTLTTSARPSATFTLLSGEHVEDLDFGYCAFDGPAVPLELAAPAGAMAYSTTLAASILRSDEADRFTINLQPGQTASLVVRPLAGSLDLAAVLKDPSGAAVASADSAGPGAAEFVQFADIGWAGTYMVEVTPNAGAGEYEVLLVLNAVVLGAFPFCLGLITQSVDLDGTFRQFAPGLSRGAILAAHSSADYDWYSFTLAAGESAGAAISSPGDMGLALFAWDGVVPTPTPVGNFQIQVHTTGVSEIRAASSTEAHDLFPLGSVVEITVPGEGTRIAQVVGYSSRYALLDRLLWTYLVNGDVAIQVPFNMTLLAEGSEADDGQTAVLDGFVAPEAGRYYLRVSGASGSDYGLAVTRGAAFDAERTGSPAGGQDITDPGAALGWTGAADDGDYYSFRARAGDVLSLRTLTPAGGPHGLGSELDPILELYDPAGNLIASDDNGAGGVNAAIAHTTAVNGRYTVRVVAAAGTRGEYVLRVEGHSRPPVEFRALAAPARATGYSEIIIEFASEVLPASLTGSAVVVNGLTTTGCTVVDGDTVRFTLAAPLVEEGVYDVTMAAGAVTDVSGRALEAYAGQIVVDQTAPHVVGVEFNVDAIPQSLTVEFDEVMSAALAAGELMLRDLTAGVDVAAGALAVALGSGGASAEWTFPLLPAGRLAYGHVYQLVLSGAVSDVAGNALAGGPYTSAFRAALSADANLDLAVDYEDYKRILMNFGRSDPIWADADFDEDGDVDYEDYKTILQGFGQEMGDSLAAMGMLAVAAVEPHAVEPMGSLIYRGTTGGSVAFSQAGACLIDLDAAQTVTVVLTPDSTLSATIELLGPAGPVAGPTPIAAAGEPVLLQTAPVDVAGTYQVTIRAAGATSGEYTMELTLNAAVEGAPHDGLATAQDLDVSFIDLSGGSGQRGAVLGQMTDGEEEWYSVTLAAGQSASAALDGVWTGAGAMELYDSAGALVTIAGPGSGVRLAIDDFVAPVAAVCYLRLAGIDGEYSLVVARGAGLDLGPDTAAEPAPDLDAGGAVLGYYDLLPGDLQTERQALRPADLIDPSRLGASLAVCGDVLLVGDPYDPTHGSQAGGACFYRFDGDQWVWQQTVTASDGAAGDRFGGWVAIAGDVAIIGADGNNISSIQGDAGAAYVFRFDGAQWVEEQRLTASDRAASDLFGLRIATDGTRTLIGAWGDDDKGDRSGSVYFFRFDGSQWVQEQKLTASDGAALCRFGTAVALSGDYALVAAQSDNAAGAEAGAVYAFHFDGAQWVEQQKIIASDPAEKAHFGYSISIDGETALIGAYGDASTMTGAVYVFHFDGAQWVQRQKLTAADAAAGDAFGISVALRGGMALIGAYTEEDPGRPSRSGSAYVFALEAGQWVQQCKLLAGDPAENQALGSSVALHDGGPIVGTGGLGAVTGASAGVYVYDPLGVDVHAFTAAAGDSLTVTITAPGREAGQFVNSYAPAIELIDPAGLLVAADVNPAGEAEATITHTAATDGLYTVRVRSANATQGEYVLRVAGNTAPAPTLDVTACDLADNAWLAQVPAQITLDFSDELMRAGVSADGGESEAFVTTFVAALAGDANASGQVDYEDYKIILRAFGRAAPASGDGDLDYEDCKAVLDSLGKAFPGGRLVRPAMPQPPGAPAADAPAFPSAPASRLAELGEDLLDVLAGLGLDLRLGA